jgi:hypothetical protein
LRAEAFRSQFFLFTFSFFISLLGGGEAVAVKEKMKNEKFRMKN